MIQFDQFSPIPRFVWGTYQSSCAPAASTARSQSSHPKIALLCPSSPTPPTARHVKPPRRARNPTKPLLGQPLLKGPKDSARKTHLMSRKVHHTIRLLTLLLPVRRASRPCHHLPRHRHHGPHIPILQRLVQAPTHQALSIRRERDTIHAIFMTLQPLHQLTRLHVPDPHDCVKRSGSDESAVWRDGHRRDARVRSLWFMDGQRL